MADNSYAVGIVGCGGMGRAHASAYRSHEQTEVVAAADLDEEARAELADEFDVPETYDEHSVMLAAEDLDVVSVCTLHSTHAGIAIDAAESDIEGIYCEKPMATSLGEAEDMLDAADRNDVELTVGHQRRFDPAHEKARELVQGGAIGEPQTVSARSGSGLLNWGTHLIDMTRYLLDDPDYEWVMGQVERRTDRYERGLAIEDRCLAQISFADGVRLTHESDMPGPEYADTMLQVTGSDGVLQLALDDSLRVVNADGETEYDPSEAESPMEGFASQQEAYVAEFVEWIDGDRDDHRCSGAEGLTVMEIMMALYESARTRGVVEAPLETRANPLKVMVEDGDLPVENPGAYDIRLPYASVRHDD